MIRSFNPHFKEHLKALTLLTLLITAPVLASGEASASQARGVSGLSIFLWFAAINMLIVTVAAVMKRGAKSITAKEARHKRLEKTITFTIRNDTIEIGYLFDRTREFAEDHELPVKTVFDVCLALEEMVSYVISNGFDEGERASLQVRVDLEKDQTRFTVEYQGRTLNPLEAPKIDINLPIEDLPLEGWDIHLLRLLVDDIGYERSGEKNIFTVVKKWEVTGEGTPR